MSNDNVNQPRGINGHKAGEYAEHIPTPPADVIPARDPADIFGAVKGSSNGLWDVQSAQSEIQLINGSYMIPMGGEPRKNTRIGAALRLYTSDDRYDMRRAFLALVQPDGEPVEQKVTVLVGVGNRVQAIEGVARFDSSGRLNLWCKASKRNYYPFNGGSPMMENLLDFRKGYNKQDELAAAFDKVAGQVPVTELSSFDGIPEYSSDEDSEDTVAAAYLINSHDFGEGVVPGCMFLATSIQTEDGIVNGYFWAPDDQGQVTSEFSSCYVKDSWSADGRRMLQRGLTSLGGRIRDYEPGSLSTSDAWQNLSENRANGYAQILGKQSISL